MKDTALSSRMNVMLPGRVTETAHAGYRTVKAFPQRIRDIALLGRTPKNDTWRSGGRGCDPRKWWISWS